MRFACPRAGDAVWAAVPDAAFGERYLVVNYLLDLVPQLPAGPDYATAHRELVLRPSTAEAQIKVDLESDHHVLCYAPMLSYPSFLAHEAALLPIDQSERASVLGDASTVTEEAKLLEHLVDAGAQIVSPGTLLKTMAKFSVA